MSAQSRAYARLLHYQLFRSNIQIGGGCGGGSTCSINVSSTKDGGGRSLISGNEIAVGDAAPVKLKHLKHAKEALPSAGGQHGIYVSSGIDISIDAAETPGPPVTGAMLSEMARSAVRSTRRPVMIETIRCWPVERQPTGL
jgi:hypothetical protein